MSFEENGNELRARFKEFYHSTEPLDFNDAFKFEKTTTEVVEVNKIATEIKKIPLRVLCAEAGLNEAQTNVILSLDENVKKDYLIDDWNAKLYKILAYILRLNFDQLTIPLPSILRTENIDDVRTQKILMKTFNHRNMKSKLTEKQKKKEARKQKQQLAKLQDLEPKTPGGANTLYNNENFAREAQNICRNKDLYLLLVNTAIYGNFNYKYYENLNNYHKAAEYFALSGFGDSLDSTYQFSEYDMKTTKSASNFEARAKSCPEKMPAFNAKKTASRKKLFKPRCAPATTTAPAPADEFNLLPPTTPPKFQNAEAYATFMPNNIKVSISSANTSSYETTAAGAGAVAANNFISTNGITNANGTNPFVSQISSATATTNIYSSICASASANTVAASGTGINANLFNQPPPYFGVNYPYQQQAPMVQQQQHYVPRAAPPINFLTSQQILLQASQAAGNYLPNYQPVFQQPQPMYLANTVPFSSPYFNACFNETHINTSIIQQQQQYNFIGNNGPRDMLIFAQMLQKTQQITQTIFANNSVNVGADRTQMHHNSTQYNLNVNSNYSNHVGATFVAGTSGNNGPINYNNYSNGLNNNPPA